MGKFAGFLKRVKNFFFETIPNKVGPSLAKGMFKINKFYNFIWNFISLSNCYHFYVYYGSAHNCV